MFSRKTINFKMHLHFLS